jgi:hypothetical protein
LLTDSLDWPIRPRTVRRSEMVVSANLLLYVCNHGVLEVTALVGDPLLSHAKGSDPFDEYGCCTVSIRVLALFEPNIAAVVVLYYQYILGVINLWVHVQTVKVDDLVRLGCVQSLPSWSWCSFAWSSVDAVKVRTHKDLDVLAHALPVLMVLYSGQRHSVTSVSSTTTVSNDTEAYLHA